MSRMTQATEMRPLQGRTIVITRAAAQAQRFVELLEAEGARVLAAPTIAIEPPPTGEPLVDAGKLGRALVRGRAPRAPQRRHRRVDRAGRRGDGGGVWSSDRRDAGRVHDPRADARARGVFPRPAAPAARRPPEKECVMAQ